MAKRDLDLGDLDSVNGGFLPLIALGAAYLGPTATMALVGAGTAAALNPAGTAQTLTNVVQHVQDAYNWFTGPHATPEPSAFNPMGDYTGVPTPQPAPAATAAAGDTAPIASHDAASPMNEAPSATPPADTGDFPAQDSDATQLADASNPGEGADLDVG